MDALDEQKVTEFVKKNIITIAFVIVFILFILTREFIFAILVPIFVILLLLPRDISKNNLKHELKEMAISLIVAVSLWFILSFALNTSAPLDTITSCSMLPNYERGDLVILQGAEPKAPELNVSAVSDIKVIKEACKVSINGVIRDDQCTTALQYNNQTIKANFDNDVVVYVPLPKDQFASAGIIIHRVFAKLNINGTKLYLTKGDNNDALDQELGNQAVSKDRLHGKVILRIPYVGFVKLLVFGQFNAPEGCNIKIQ